MAGTTFHDSNVLPQAANPGSTLNDILASQGGPPGRTVLPGHVSSNSIVFTGGDNSGLDQLSCANSLTTQSAYTVDASGAGTLSLVLAPSTCLTPGLNLNWVINNEENAGRTRKAISASLLFTGFPFGAITDILGNAVIASIVLQGELRLQGFPD
jgi:hypothetical protein